MRGIVRRGLRLELVAAFGIALATPTLAVAAESLPRQATQTDVTVETHDQGGRTQAVVAVSGAVAVSDRGTQLAGAALNAQGQASLTISLPAGDHLLRAVYKGDSTHQGSLSAGAAASGQSSSTPGFTVSLSPATLTLTPGQSGTITTSVPTRLPAPLPLRTLRFSPTPPLPSPSPW